MPTSRMQEKETTETTIKMPDKRDYRGQRGRRREKYIQWCLDHVLTKGHHTCCTHDRLCTYSSTKCMEKTYEETQISCAQDSAVHMFDDHMIEARLYVCVYATDASKNACRMHDMTLHAHQTHAESQTRKANSVPFSLSFSFSNK